MLQYRLPLEKSLVNPKRSFCPNCGTPLKWYENIPLLSYLLLRGKCHTCKEEVSKTYLIIELTTALITLGLYLKFGLSLDFFIILFVSYTLILLAFIDLKHKAVPDYLLVIVLVSGAFYSEFSYLYCLVFAGVGVLLDFFVSFYIQNIKIKFVNDERLKEQKALGEGDIPIFALVGGILGLQLGIIAIFVSAVLALIPALLSNIIKGDKELPFIPFLSLGLFLTLFFDKNIVAFVQKVTQI